MDYTIASFDDELYHFGVKGMKWGVRRYQNKDGTLTAAGKKRYDKATETLKDSSKGSFAKKRAQKTVDKLGGAKQATEKQETTEEKRQRLLKSTDAKELYENRNLLTTNEINERINRIDTEAKLRSKIVEEQVKTGMDYVNDRMQGAARTIDNANKLFKSVDGAYSSVANSSIGKMLAKQLGIEPPKKKFDIDDFWKNRHNKTAQEMMEANKWLNAEASIKKNMDARNKESEAEARRKEAQKQVDDYNKQWQQGDSSTYSKRGQDLNNNRDYTMEINNPPAVVRSSTNALSKTTLNSNEARSKASTGERYAQDILDRDGNVIARFDENGNVDENGNIIRRRR